MQKDSQRLGQGQGFAHFRRRKHFMLVLFNKYICNALFTQVDEGMEQTDLEGDETERIECDVDPEDRGKDEEGNDEMGQRGVRTQKESDLSGDDSARSEGVDRENYTQVKLQYDLLLPRDASRCR